MTNPFKGATLADIAVALNGASAKDVFAVRKAALEVLALRSEAAKPGSYKQRRTDIAIAQIKAGQGVDAKAAFEQAKASPKAAPVVKAAKQPRIKASAKSRTKTRIPAEVRSALDELTPEQRAGVMALLGAK